MNLIILAFLNGAQAWSVFQVVVMLLLALILGVLLGLWLRSKNNGLSELKEEFDRFKKDMLNGQSSQDKSIESLKSSYVSLDSELKVEKEINVKQNETIKIFESSFVTIKSDLGKEQEVNTEQNKSLTSIKNSINGFDSSLKAEQAINEKQNVEISSLTSGLKSQEQVNNDQNSELKHLETKIGAIDITPLQSAIDTLKSELHTEQEINTQQNESLNNVHGLISGFESNLDQERQVNERQNQDISSISSRLDSQEQINNDQDARINSLDVEPELVDLSPLNGAIDALRFNHEESNKLFNDEKSINEQQNIKISSLEARLQSQEKINNDQDSKIKSLDVEPEAVDLSPLQGAIDALRTNQEENNRLFNDASDAFKDLDREKDVIDSNGKGLQAEVLMLKSENQRMWAAINAKEATPKPIAANVVGANDKETKALQSVAAKKHLINFSSIGEATESDKDDLKIIKGIGPFIEKKLNALDIWTFAQIASFEEDDINSVTDAIEFFPGRIVRDNWVSQAKELK